MTRPYIFDEKLEKEKLWKRLGLPWPPRRNAVDTLLEQERLLAADAYRELYNPKGEDDGGTGNE